MFRMLQHTFSEATVSYKTCNKSNLLMFVSNVSLRGVCVLSPIKLRWPEEKQLLFILYDWNERDN